MWMSLYCLEAQALVLSLCMKQTGFPSGVAACRPFSRPPLHFPPLPLPSEPLSGCGCMPAGGGGAVWASSNAA